MSIPYVKASEPHMLETYTPEVCIDNLLMEAYVFDCTVHVY